MMPTSVQYETDPELEPLWTLVNIFVNMCSASAAQMKTVLKSLPLPHCSPDSSPFRTATPMEPDCSGHDSSHARSGYFGQTNLRMMQRHLRLMHSHGERPSP